MGNALKEAFRIEVKLGAPYVVGPVNGGTLRVVPIVGGTVTGERLQGEVVPLGADWNLARSDGLMSIYARYLLKTKEGVLIAILNQGIGRLSDERIEAVIRREGAPPSDWYCKAHPVFEVADARYAWLNATFFVSELLPPQGPDVINIVFYAVE